MGFCRQDCWSGWPFYSSGCLHNPGIGPRSPALQADSLPSEPLGSARVVFKCSFFSRLVPPFPLARVPSHCWPLPLSWILSSSWTPSCGLVDAPLCTSQTAYALDCDFAWWVVPAVLPSPTCLGMQTIPKQSLYTPVLFPWVAVMSSFPAPGRLVIY